MRNPCREVIATAELLPLAEPLAVGDLLVVGADKLWKHYGHSGGDTLLVLDLRANDSVPSWLLITACSRVGIKQYSVDSAGWQQYFDRF